MVNKVDEILVEIGQEIKSAREKRDWSQQELADKAQLSLSHLQHIEAGKVNFSFDMLFSIFNELGLSVDAFLFSDSFDFGAETSHLRIKLRSCTPMERKFIVNTMDYMASQFIENHQNKNRADATD